jgi:hypothetical protein
MKLLAVDEHIVDKLTDLVNITSADAPGHAKLIEDAITIPSVGEIKEWFNNTRLLITKVLTFNDGEEVCVFGRCVH